MNMGDYDYAGRWDNLAKKLEQEEMDAYVVGKGPNVRYMSCAHIPSGPIYTYLVIDTSSNVTGIVSSLEEFRVRDEGAVEDIRVFAPYEGIETYAPKALNALSRLLKERGYRKVGCDTPLEGLDNGEGVETEVKDVITEMRIRKDSDEISALKRAAAIAREGAKYLEDIVGVGMSEREVARKLDYKLSELGSEAVAFPTIIATGPKHSAYPHHDPTERKIQEGDAVICDFGATYKGYISDMTRTYLMPPVDEEMETIYETVKEAQSHAIEGVRKGKNYSDLDDIARNIIKDRGWARYFVHSLGHGIGLEVHEAPLGIRHESKEVIDVNHAFTVEPGIYVPGKGGVRIEDDVLVTEDGYEIISRG